MQKVIDLVSSGRIFDRLLLFFVIIALAFKFIGLGSFPPGMAHDEFDNILGSRSIAFTGRGLTGVPFPLFFFKTDIGSKQTNVAPFLLSPYFRFAVPNLYTARLPFVFANLITILGAYKLLGLFTKDRRLKLIFLFVMLVSPWMFDFGRRVFAVPFSLMFMVWAMYFLFREKCRPVVSAVLFVLASFCYFGSFVVVPPIALLLFLFQARSKKKYKVYILPAIIVLVSVSLYLLASFSVDGGTAGQRLQEVVYSTGESVPQMVETGRRLSIVYPGRDILTNKYTVIAWNFLRGYFNTFNVDSLFFSGDPRVNYTYVGHGLLYLLDAVFIFVGVLSIWRRNRKLFWISLFILLISPIGAAINKVTYTFIYRSFPLVLAFTLLSAFGLWELSKTKFRNLFLIGYFLFYIYFLVFYFLMHPVALGENFDVAQRTAVNVALRERALGHSVKIISESAYHLAKQLVFYGSIEETYLIPIQSSYEFDGITITESCDFTGADVYIEDPSLQCDNSGNPNTVIQQQKDAGYRYNIYGGSACGNVNLDYYKRDYRLGDYSIESLDNNTFCNRWIFRPL